jgi:hypothetical protein
LGESTNFWDPVKRLPCIKEVSNTGPFDLLLSDISGVNERQGPLARVICSSRGPCLHPCMSVPKWHADPQCWPIKTYIGRRGWYQKYVKWKDNNIKEDNLLSVKKKHLNQIQIASR